MSQLLYGSICVSDLPQSKMKQGKNGKWYLDINVWINDQLDQYGNIAGVSVGQSKEERVKEKRIYIGNLKTPQQAAPQTGYTPAPQAAGYAPASQQGAPAGYAPAALAGGYATAPAYTPTPAPAAPSGYAPPASPAPQGYAPPINDGKAPF